MIRLDIGEERLAKLFPAYMIVDQAGSILAIGPSLARQIPELVPGSNLFDHFRLVGAINCSNFSELAQSGRHLELTTHDTQINLSGSMLAVESNYLLAIRHLPPRFSLKTNELKMSDFGPDDPSVPGLLLVGLQQAMIEESREIALELGQERQRSAEMFDRFSRVAGYTAHDFNNLLSIIRLNADRIKNTSGLSSRIRRLAAMIAETAGRGSEVSSSLMTISHQRQDSRSILEPDLLIATNLPFFQTIVGRKVQIELSLHASGRMIEVSRIGLLNSLINLIVNARDAMSASGLLQISTVLSTPENKVPRDHIAIVISDSGHGMTDDVLANAFKPMFSSKPTGNGMGLASVLEFTTTMGGEVRLDSEPGMGTSCYIYLPEAFLPADLDDSQTPEARLEPGLANRTSPRIILVEDEPFALEALTELLELQGHDVVPCSSAQEARAALATGNFQLLLSDVVLKDDSGIVLAGHAREIAPDMAVILMSGYVPELEIIQDDWHFIRKPLDSDLLCNIIASALKLDSRGT